MKPQVGRRVFVGSVVAGLPLLAGAGTGLLAQSRPAARPQPPVPPNITPVPDPVIDHIARQIADVHARARARGNVIGEDARILAAHFRTLSVYAGRTDLDQLVRQRGRDLIREKGRDALLFAKPDEAALRADLRAYGLNVDRRFFEAFGVSDYAQRERALDELLRDGVSPTFAQLGGVFERIAPDLDLAYVRLARVSARGQDAAYWAGYCAELQRQIAKVAAMESLACGGMFIPFFGVLFTPSCAAVTGGMSILSAVYFFRC